MERAACGTLLVLLLVGSGCGYLDEEMFFDEQTFEEELWMEGMSLHGVGMSGGCGGIGGFGYGSYGHGYEFDYGHSYLPPTGDYAIGPGLYAGFGAPGRGGAGIDQEKEFQRDGAPEGTIGTVILETKERREKAVAGFVQMRSSRDAR